MQRTLGCIFLELPKFNKRAEELDGDIFDGMCFCLKNMPSLKEKPKALRHKVFNKVFEMSELLKMDRETRLKVLENMNTERDLRNQMEYAIRKGHEEGLEKGLAEGRLKGIAAGREEGRAEGREEGREEGRAEVIGKMLEAGMTAEEVAGILGIEASEVLSLTGVQG